MLVEPNRIDFRKALRGFVELSENPMVFTLVLSILGVYILLLIWARRRDIRNAKKVYVVSHPFPPLSFLPLFFLLLFLCHFLDLPSITLEFSFLPYNVLHFFSSACLGSAWLLLSLPPIFCLLLLLSFRYTVTSSFSSSWSLCPINRPNLFWALYSPLTEGMGEPKLPN